MSQQLVSQCANAACASARTSQPRSLAPRPFTAAKSFSAVSSIAKTAGLKAQAASSQKSVRAAAVAARAEISYVMIKPDGVQRGLVGDIISRFERKGFTLRALKLFQTPRELAEEHYKDLAAKPFFPKLVDYILSGPVVCMVWEGAGVVKSARKIIGATNPLEAEPGTIRGDFAIEVGRNVVHGSDSTENGERETALWFGKDAVVAWDPAMTPWLIE